MISKAAQILLDYLTDNCNGAGNSQILKNISYVLNIRHGFSRDTRKIQTLAGELRDHGHKVVTSCGKRPGMYIAINHAEVLPYARQISNRIIGNVKLLMQIKGWLSESDRQEVFAFLKDLKGFKI